MQHLFLACPILFLCLQACAADAPDAPRAGNCSTMTDEEFLIGVGETANTVVTYDASYSSGVFIFGGGDSGDIQRRELIDRLRDLGTST